MSVSPAGEDEPLRGGRQAEPSGPQQPPNSGGCNDTPETDLSATHTLQMRKHVRRHDVKRRRRVGTPHVVKQRGMKVEDHYDDCGEDLRRNMPAGMDHDLI